MKPRGIVRHDISRARKVFRDGAVAMSTLESTVEETEAGSCPIDCGGAFRQPSYGRSVVATSNDSGVANRVTARDQIQLGDHPSLFKVAVRDEAMRVRGGDEGALDVVREREAPDVTLPCRVKVYSAHASFGSVSSPYVGGRLGHYFGEVRRPSLKVSGEGTEDRDVVC